MDGTELAISGCLGLLLLIAIIWLYRCSGRRLALPDVPRVTGVVPWLGCGLQFVGNPRKFLEDTQKKYGDDFVLAMFGTEMLFTFSAPGLEALYKIKEVDASFTEATRAFLGLKLPPELVSGTMTMFHKRLKKSLLEGYVKEMNAAVVDQLICLDDSGQFELFAFMRQIVHQVGFRVWLGPETAKSEYLSRFIKAFDTLDVEKGFQSLSSLFVTSLSGKYYEKKALKELEDVLRNVWEMQQDIGTSSEEENANFATLHEMYGHLPSDKRFHQVAIDVFQFHLASQANMYASLSWTLANILLHDDCRKKLVEEMQAASKKFGQGYTYMLEALDELHYLEEVVQESLRMSQQSLTLRKVMRPCSFMSYSLPKGMYIATLLSMTNTNVGDSEPGPDVFHPGRKSMCQQDTVDQYYISTFGHGFHSCPGLKFAMSLSKIVICNMLQDEHALTMTPLFSEPIPIPKGSVGAVARSSSACMVEYRKVK